MPDAGEEIDFPPSRFTRVVRLLNSIMYPNLEEKAGADEKDRKKQREKRKREFVSARKRFEKVQKSTMSGTLGFRQEEVRFIKAKESYAKSEKKLHDVRLKMALALGHLDLEPYEVRSFSNIVFVVLLLVLLFTSIILAVLAEFNLAVIIGCLVLTILIPGLTSLYIDEYPFIRAKRTRALTVGRMPEAIHYLSLSMRLSPSLDRAVKYASSSLSEPLASDLRKVLWDVYMREYSSVEEAFIAFAYGWSEWDEDFKRALYMVSSASLERDQDGINRVLDKANQIIIDGTKRKLEDFSAALRLPSLVLFAIGIMLPLLLVMIIPIMGFGDRWKWPAILAINGVLPVSIGIYTYHILGKRPELVSPPEIPSTMSRGRRATYIFLCLSVSAALFLLTLYLWPSMYSYILVSWMVGLPIAIYCYLSSRGPRRKSVSVRKMEDEYPEALFQLGNRIAEGKPFERALMMTAATMKNTLVSKLFQKISYNLQVTRSSLRDILFSPTGLMVRSPSRVIRNTMHTVVEASAKDPLTAGRTIILISNYLSDLKKVEKEMKEKLGEVTGMMSLTAASIAPLVIGITIVLYHFLSAQLQIYAISAEMDVDMGRMGQQAISPAAISISLGLYLIQLVFVVSYFVSRINHGRNDLELKNTLAVYIVVALISFTVGVLSSQLLVHFYADLPPVSGWII